MEIEFPRTRYFTFGFDHRHPITEQPLFKCYIELTEYEVNGARMKIIEVFGNRWAFEYGPEQYDRAIAKYNLRRINLDGTWP